VLLDIRGHYAIGTGFHHRRLTRVSGLRVAPSRRTAASSARGVRPV
jgi:hypothetical protein